MTMTYVDAVAGADTFRNGLTRYLGEHQYGNVVPDDLWNALSVVAGFDVAELMNAWVNAPGYPLISVNTQALPAQISQQRFFETANASVSEQLWWVPLTFYTSSSPAVVQTGVLSV